ncbi:ubiquitin-ribosomal 60S subunit protein L40B fusion protein [Pelomyxa schiedti]|nr:ubiquitin-ribosomal 60S subunit protein L40B fusion protein [Pelomyxa schiedti]
MAANLTIQLDNSARGSPNCEITVPVSATLAELQTAVETATGVKIGFQSLIFEDKTIAQGADATNTSVTIASLGMIPGQTLVLEVTKSGGQKTNADPKMSISTATDGHLAQLPCGHFISPDELTGYIRYILGLGRIAIQCPFKPSKTGTACNRNFTMEELGAAARLTIAETREFEEKVGDNFLLALGMQNCPKCNIMCQRTVLTDPRVICCGKPWCWYCRREWKGSDAVLCGNEDCPKKDPFILILEQAEEALAYDVPIFKTRSCVNCGLLITHNGACKHMLCTRCQVEFCFSCLSRKTAGKYPPSCGAYSTKCPRHPRQTVRASLPLGS